MTPFGARLRELRAAHGLSMRQLAEQIQVSSAYLSALEHGHRGRPGRGLVHQICDVFGLIWDEAEEMARLARQSHPRVVLDTAGLSPAHTALANRLAQAIDRLPPDAVAELDAVLDRHPLARRPAKARAKAPA